MSLDPPETPVWTDANESDPGISILEVLAWLALAVLFVVAVRTARRRHTRHDD